MQILTPLLSSPHIEGKKKKGTGEENEKNNAGACKAKTAVEVDGSIHEQDERKEYDSIREEVIKAHGIRIIRFTNEDIIAT
ncbi:uncharacterized protein DUF559 [Anaerobacterium chartisolvens]|uniref:Uncharacterized protein DUF559 n=1 Tax=Anaerobacterium chartisolvens TaxID=1297424 RepID=A0A369B981_9FIRM|nr:DUF559 domain-containing protein [Anaerobacterium chartisolvens]RCX17971.1 uncharacterized protein DUF559 [Anaerobacterium chartisolvens]